MIHGRFATPNFTHKPAHGQIGAGSALNLLRIGCQGAAVIALLLVNTLGVAGNAVFFATLTAMIVWSPEFAFKALTIGFLGLISNQAIVPKTPVWTVARLLIPIVCLIRFSLDLSSMRQSLLKYRWYLALLAFISVAAVLSILTQYYVEIALLKLFNFTCGVTAILSGVQVLRMRKTDMTEWFVLLCTVTVALSFASLAGGFAYNMRGTSVFANSLFNGSMYHSNSFGPLAAMMNVYLICVALFGRYRNRWLCILLAGCLVYFMALTQSRTSFGALFAGILLVVGLSFLLARNRFVQLRVNASRFALIGGLAAAGIVLLYVDFASGNRVTKAIIAFANKGATAEQFELSTVLASRQALIDESYRNFLASPWIGIGFEVAKTEFFRSNATLFYAPIEKGFLPLAVLEETGIIGFVFFVVFLLLFVRVLIRELNVPGLAMFVTFLAVNCGEAMFFALGGHGGFGWLLCAGGLLLGNACIQPRNETAAPNNAPRLRNLYVQATA